MTARRLALLAAAAILAGNAQVAADPAPTLTVHFSPHGGCSQAVVAFIGEAKQTIRLSAYGFTSAPIADALVAARKRGVDVRAVLDRSDAGPKAGKNSKATAVKSGGVLVWIDAKHPIMHDKFVVVDGVSVETGSYNYTSQGENNAQNCLVVRDAGLAQAYAANWAEHQAHSAAL